MVSSQNKVNGTRRIKIQVPRPAGQPTSLRGNKNADQREWHFVKMKFSDNWAVCSCGDRFLIEWTMSSGQRLQSNAIYSDHGSYSHIPHWLVIRTYNSEYVTITTKLCRFATHRTKNQDRKKRTSTEIQMYFCQTKKPARSMSMMVKLKYLH